MAFTKYASFEVSAILDVKGSSTRVKHASLSKVADFEDFRTEDGYLYARIRAISSRVNKNHDGWPSVELAGGQDVFDTHRHTAGEGVGFTVEASEGAEYGFSTFLGKPIFVDHNNSDPDRARGVVVDAKLHVEDHKTASLDPYYASADVDQEHVPATWIELLLEVDAKAFPKFAKAIIDGANDAATGIDGFSMGCNVEKSVCNICKNAASAPDEFCNHIRMKGRNFQIKGDDGRHRTAKSYENCYGVQFFEISGVFEPADETALVREVRASVNREAAFEEPCPECMGRGMKQVDNHGFVHCPTCQGAGTTGQQFGGNPQGGDGAHAPGRVGPRDMQGVGVNYNPTADVLNDADLRGVLPVVPRQGSTRTADNPLPQDDLIKAPEMVDTLREDKACPICGEALEDGSCDLCGYIEPPEGLNNPDLGKAQEAQEVPQQSGPDGSGERMIPPQGLPPSGPPQPITPTKGLVRSHVKGDMQWKVVPHPRLAGRINSVERPVTPGTTPSSNEPRETVIKDENRPVTSSVRTAGDILASVGREQENHMKRVADSADAAAAPDVRTDATGVGGITDASNEQASKADAQVDVEATGGTGVENVEADSTATNNATSDNAGFQPGGQKGPETDTWSGTDGNGVTKQLDAVTTEPFPASDEGVKRSHDSGPFPEEDGGLGGGSAVQGVKPIAEQFGERVDVLQSLTSPSNNSGPTTTWHGTDGNGVLKQQEPTTSEVFAPWTSKTVASVQLAELEIELGLLPASQKWARIAELTEAPDVRVATELAYAQRVRTAGLKRATRTASVDGEVTRVAKKLPVLGRPTQMRTTSVQTPDDDPLGGTLFGL